MPPTKWTQNTTAEPRRGLREINPNTVDTHHGEIKRKPLPEGMDRTETSIVEEGMEIPTPLPRCAYGYNIKEQDRSETTQQDEKKQRLPLNLPHVSKTHIKIGSAVGIICITLAIFGIVAVVAVARNDPQDPVCYTGLRYRLVRDATHENLTGILSLSVRDQNTIVICRDDETVISTVEIDPSTHDVTMQNPIDPHQVSKYFYNPVDAASDGSTTWISDARMHMVVGVNTEHRSGVALSLGRFGQSGGDDASFNAPISSAIDSDILLVLDSGNSRVKMYNKTTGKFLKSISDPSFGNGRSIASHNGVFYAACRDGIHVYDYVNGTKQGVFDLRYPDAPLDSLRNSLKNWYWKDDVSSVSVTPTEHLLTSEGGQVYLRSLSGDLICRFGSARNPTSAVMLKDQRILMSEKGRIQVYSLSRS
eukprot:TRINITY_DN13181_c0_g1_i1.p1 TRINITY_DN13181_c0_g1~~TRINITY_DN13181_c0_g1_i1.p1  ORF type:complete len:437 (+),score=44.03 TRINITY_DN13181_c0_g1_i1:52-1311(+)